MAKYEKNDEGKYQCPVCEYGRGENGKSRQSVSKHYNALHAEESPAPTVEPKTENTPIEGVDVNDGVFDDSSPNTPEWLQFDMSEDDEDAPTVSLSPTASSVLKGMREGNEPPSNPKALKEFYEQQGKMMKWIFAGVVDPAFSWYGKSITTDPDFSITRSKADWELFESVSSSWLEYHGVRLPVTPDIIFAGTIASFYAPVMLKIHRKRDPLKPSVWSRFKSRRAMRKALKRRKLDVSE